MPPPIPLPPVPSLPKPASSLPLGPALAGITVTVWPGGSSRSLTGPDAVLAKRATGAGEETDAGAKVSTGAIADLVLAGREAGAFLAAGRTRLA